MTKGTAKRPRQHPIQHKNVLISNRVPAQWKQGEGESCIRERKHHPTAKGTRKRPRYDPVHTKRSTNAYQKEHQCIPKGAPMHTQKPLLYATTYTTKKPNPIKDDDERPPLPPSKPTHKQTTHSNHDRENPPNQQGKADSQNPLWPPTGHNDGAPGGI